MKANQVATLALRLIGIYALLEFIPAVAISISTVPIFVDSEMNWSASKIIAICVPLLIFACQLTIGVLLIVKSVPWGERLAASNSEETNMAISFEQAQVLTFAAFGALIFAGALPQLLNGFYGFFNSLHEIIHKNPYANTSQYYNWRTLLISVGTFLKAALGAWMFFGARGFTNFWRSMRSFGTPKAPAVES